MAERHLDLSIPRFKENEERFDRFVNEPEGGGFIAEDGAYVPSVRSVVKAVLSADSEAAIRAGTAAGIEAGRDYFDTKLAPIEDALEDAEQTTRKGQAGGYASLGADGKVPASQLPAIESGSSDADKVMFRPTSAPTVLIPVGERLGQEVYLTDGWTQAGKPTDFTGLAKANLARAVADKRPLVIPHGEFALRENLSANLTSIMLAGMGKYQSALVWKKDAASVGMRFTSGTNRKRPSFMHFHDLALLTEQFNLGEALWASFENEISPNNGNPVVANRYSTRFRCQDVAIAGYDGAFTDGWNKGATVLYEIDAIFRDVQINGPIGSGGEPDYKMKHGIYIGGANGYGHPTGPFVDTCNVFHAERAVIFEGNEGGVVSNSQLVGVIIGVDFQDNEARPLFMVTNTHINAFGACIKVDSCQQAQIIGNCLYHTIGADRDGHGVLVSSTRSKTREVIIKDNTFQSAINSTKIFTGVSIVEADYGNIDGNTFTSGIVGSGQSNFRGIVLGSGARWFTVGNQNQFEDARSGRAPVISGAKILDGGTENFIPGLGAHYAKSYAQGVSNYLSIISFDYVAGQVGNVGDDMNDGAFIVPSDGVWQFTAGIVCDNAGGGQGLVTVNIQRNATSGNPVANDVRHSDPGENFACTLTTGPIAVTRGEAFRVGVNSGSGYRQVLSHAGTFFKARRIQ